MGRRGFALLISIIVAITTFNVNAIEDKQKTTQVIVTNKQVKETLPYISKELNYPIITVSKYKEAQDMMNTKINIDINTWANGIILEAKKCEDDYKQFQGELLPYEIVTKYKVALNKKDLLSIPIDYYQYTGGAHGMTTRLGYNFQVSTGKIIKLADLFNPDYDYKSVINKEVEKQIAKNPEYYFDNGAVFKGIKDQQDFYLTEDGLVIYFQLYEIAPYVGGIREFKIPYVDLKQGLKFDI